MNIDSDDDYAFHRVVVELDSAQELGRIEIRVARAAEKPELARNEVVTVRSASRRLRGELSKLEQFKK